MSRSAEPRFAFAVLLYSRRRGGTTDYWSWLPCGSSGGAILRWWCVLMSAKVMLGVPAVVVGGGCQR